MSRVSPYSETTEGVELNRNRKLTGSPTTDIGASKRATPNIGVRVRVRVRVRVGRRMVYSRYRRSLFEYNI